LEKSRLINSLVGNSAWEEKAAAIIDCITDVEVIYFYHKMLPVFNVINPVGIHVYETSAIIR